LSQQNYRRKKLGELLIEQEIISVRQLEQILEKQYWQKKWLLVNFVTLKLPHIPN